MKVNSTCPVIKALQVLAAISCLLTGCSKKESVVYLPEKVMEVCINDIPFRTEKYLRIPYTLKLWEYKKEGLKIQKIVVLNFTTGEELISIDSTSPDPPRIFSEPLPVVPFFTFDHILHYYLSLQLPIPLTKTPPAEVIHRFEFRDTILNKPVIYTGAKFSPRLAELPVSILSPVKGKNWLMLNQSTNQYHFNVLFFMYGKVYSSERFAFDNVQFNDELTTWLEGDSTVNESYFNYRDTLYAVAAGKIVLIQDGLPENSGNAHNVTFQTAEELAGNYLILKLGNNLFAYYCHCAPYSFLVNLGDSVPEGTPLALLGNSGNSDAPHLHFELADGPEIWNSNGMPFVFKSYVKTANMGFPPEFITPTQYTNCMMEWASVVQF